MTSKWIQTALNAECRDIVLLCMTVCCDALVSMATGIIQLFICL